jgi:GAF domain-containing protein
MRGRSRAGGKSVKARPYKAATLKRRKASKTLHTGNVGGGEATVAGLTRELREALEQQAATSEVLKVISSSPGELEPVFQATLENATRLCEAKFGVVFYYRGGTFHPAAELNTPAAYSEFIRQRGSFPPAAGSTFEHLIRTKQVINLTDAAAQGPFSSNAAAKFGGARSQISVPMLKEDELIGAIAIYRQQVLPFTDKQIELVKNFAAQAVIAIENTRLLNELRESLQEQTATADVLKVISRTTFDLRAVLDILVESATRLCDTRDGFIFLPKGDVYRAAAGYGVTPEYHKHVETNPVRIDRGSVVGRAAIEERLVHVPDVLADPEYTRHEAQKIGGWRAALGVPLLREGSVVGVFFLSRTKPQPFTDKQIALVQSFADQAVIAIENARLLNELRESLERQTATSQVLQVISSSPGELEPVFESILANATRICQANFGFLHLYENGKFQTGVARYNMPPAFADDVAKRGRFQPGPLHPLVRLAATKELLHILDYAEDPSYKQHDPLAVRLVELASARTLVEVPMLKDGELIGAIAIYRQEVRPFTEKQIELVQNFAAQAVIAIENTRLLKELRERTDQLANLNQQLEGRVADQVGEIERMSRLRRFLPQQVADLIVASGSEKQLESHRREITALFCDLRGFTGFSESSDPEDVMALLADYHAAIGTIINKYSGTLERYAGDGVMVIFNDPVPVENPALQAVLMALDMRTAIEALMAKWRLLGHDIGFGIGIAHGFATLGTIGFEGRRDYAAIGNVSNVASRLCDEAKPGQILISPRVLLAVDKAVTVESVGEFALKGIRRPMQAYNVLESKPN